MSGPQPKMSGPHSGLFLKRSRNAEVRPGAPPISPSAVTPARSMSLKLRTMLSTEIVSLGSNIPPRAV